MIARKELLSYLFEFLKVDDFSDYCVNGLQIEGIPMIRRIATGVSVSERFIQAAEKMGAEMLLVHHGLFWKGGPNPFTLTGITRNRVKRILDAQMNLVGYHLPLDAHPEVGNNALILKALDLTRKKPVDVGYIGEYETPRALDDFLERLNAILPSEATALTYGPKSIRCVGVISGGAPGKIEVMAAHGVDTYVTGEINEPLPRLAEELNMNFVAAGHYNTERFGPIALGNHLADKFDVEVEFIDIENPV